MKNGKLSLALVFSVLVLIFISCRETPSNPEGFINISGIVQDVDGVAINSATVEAVDASNQIISSVTTGENIGFSLSNIPVNIDNISLVVNKTGYKTLKVSLKSLLETTLDNKIVLILQKEEQKQDCCGNIHFKIIDDVSKSPINDVEVRLNHEGNVIAKLLTGQEGKVDFENLCPGNYWVRVYKEGYAVIEKQITVANCDPININLLLVKSSEDPCCGVVNMMIFDKTSKAGIGEVSVTLNFGDKVIEKKYTDSRGVVGFTGLCMGKYWVSIERTGYKTIIEDFNVVNCDPLNITFGMEKVTNTDCCGKIYINLIDKSTQKKLAGREVTLYQGNVAIAKKVTNDNGEVQFTDLCMGGYAIKITAEGYKAFVTEVKVSNCEPVVLNLSLEPNTDCCGKIIVTVYDKDTQNPVANAEVKLTYGGKAVTQKTNESGVTIFDGLCMGKYGLRIAREGYKVIEKSVNVENCDPINITAILEKAGTDCCGKLYYYIFDNSTKKPIAGAEIKLTSSDGKILTIKTNENGAAGFTELCMGKYYVRISREGYKVIEQVVNIENCEPVQVSLGMELIQQNDCCKGTLAVLVTDEAQKPIVGAYVKLWLNGKLIQSVKTNEQGYALMENICEGEYGVSITAEGYKGIEYKYNHPCNEKVSQTKTLTKVESNCCGKINVTVTDKATGTPIASAEVRLTTADGKVITVKTNQNGLAEFRDLCMGKYGLRIAREGYKVIEQSVNVENCDLMQLAIGLEKIEENACCKGILKVTILDKDTQKPIPGAYLKLFQAGKVIKSSKANESGVAAIDGICEGDYSVNVYAEGYTNLEYKFTQICNKTNEETKSLSKKETPCTGKLRLQYTDSLTKRYVANAEVKLYRDGVQIASTTTNSEGWAVFEALCTGKYLVKASHEGYALKDASYTVTNGQTTTDKLELVPVK